VAKFEFGGIAFFWETPVMKIWARIFASLPGWVLLASLIGSAGPALAQKVYTVNNDGTVTDPYTGLMWKRCTEGLSLVNGACISFTNGSNGTNYTWVQANDLSGAVTFAGHNDWRLPTIRELLTIANLNLDNPAIDATAFPNTPALAFWSATADPAFSYYARTVTFINGAESPDYKTGTHKVRLVRAGQALGLLDVARPSTDYVDQGDGTVRHTPTGLVWQRCAFGQVWTGNTCSGTANTYAWIDTWPMSNSTSSFAGKTDWRMPTEEELVSLVDYTVDYFNTSPSLNTSLFPNTPASLFWTAYSYLRWNPLNYWGVDFNSAGAFKNSISDPKPVRLVRAGRTFGPLTLSVKKTGVGQVSTQYMPGIECGVLCSGGYNPGETVTLYADYKGGVGGFINWEGACNGSTVANCTFMMDADKTVVAHFKPVNLTPILMLLLD
jgi:hypothetical protein